VEGDGFHRPGLIRSREGDMNVREAKRAKRPRRTGRLTRALVGIGLATALAGGACGGDGDSDAASKPTSIPQATASELQAATLDKLPLAPASARVDLNAPAFSNPTKVTNPLFPISNLRSAILSGRVDGKPFKTETTLLPEKRIIEWEGGRIEALVSQYVAYLDGQIEEVALDLYAQGDDGSVWYLGEDVFNYKDGAIADTDGTWLAGREGPPAMIMPGKPEVGDVYRPENVPGLVFEEVKVKTVNETVRGPRGQVSGAMIAQELHQDGSREEKIFAPGYGEFFTGAGGDVEAMSLAVPVDSLPGPPPAELQALSAGAEDVLERARAREWVAASAGVRRMTTAWSAFKEGDVPPRLGGRMSRALDGLVDAVRARDARKAESAAIEVAQNSLDLQLRYRPPTEIDRARFELWARQLRVDAAAGDAAAVRGDLATLEWIRDRFVHTLDRVDVVRIDAHLVELRSLVTDNDLPGASAEAARLGATLA
jgi:hypothetical protein